MMNPEIKAKWVKALRSGEYEQGRGGLLDADGKYCCLGVLQEKITGKGSWVKSPYGNWMGVRCDVSVLSTTLSTAQAREIGLSQDAIGHVMDMNDNERKSFSEIADYIEANL